MYVHKHHHVDHELLKWFLLIVLAVLLVLIATRSTAAQPKDSTIVANVASIETDCPSSLVTSEFQGLPTSSQADLDQRREEIPTARRIWAVFHLHENQDLEQAIDG